MISTLVRLAVRRSLNDTRHVRVVKPRHASGLVAEVYRQVEREFGMLAPPVGLNVYVVNSMAKDVPIAESYRGVMPFLVSDTIRTIVLLLFPSISLWLVKYIG